MNWWVFFSRILVEAVSVALTLFLLLSSLTLRKPEKLFLGAVLLNELLSSVYILLTVFGVVGRQTTAFDAVMAIVSFVLLFVCFKDKPAKKIFALIVQIGALVTGAALAGVARYFIGFESDMLIATSAADIPKFLVLFVCEYGVVFLIYLYASKKIRHYDAGGRASLFIFAGVIALFSVFTFFFNAEYREGYPNGPIITLVLLFASAAAFLALTAYCDARYRAQLVGQNAALQEQVDSRMRYYNLLEEQQSRIQKLRHDMNNHLLTINALLARGEREAAADYAREVRVEQEELYRLQYCENKAVNALIVNKALAAKDAAIEFTFAGALPELEWADDLDLVKLISNLLDNALDGCAALTCGEKYVELTCVASESSLIINCSNPFSAAATSSARPTRERPVRGQGKRIIADVVRKYAGEYTTSCENGVYAVSVSLFKPPSAS